MALIVASERGGVQTVLPLLSNRARVELEFVEGMTALMRTAIPPLCTDYCITV